MLFLSEATLMSESLYVALVTLVLLCAYRAYDDPKTGAVRRARCRDRRRHARRAPRACCSGVVVTASVVLALRGLPTRERVARVAVALGVAVALLVPWTIRNAVKFHTFVPVSNNVGHAGRRRELRRDLRRFAARPLARDVLVGQHADACCRRRQACFEGFTISDPHFDEAKASSTDTPRRARATRCITSGSLPKVAVVRVLRTWGVYSPGQQVSFESLEGRPRAWQMRGTVMYWFLAPLAIVGAVVAPAPEAPDRAARRDRGDRDDRRRAHVRPAALPYRGGTGDPRAGRGAARPRRPRREPRHLLSLVVQGRARGHHFCSATTGSVGMRSVV